MFHVKHIGGVMRSAHSGAWIGLRETVKVGGWIALIGSLVVTFWSAFGRFIVWLGDAVGAWAV